MTVLLVWLLFALCALATSGGAMSLAIWAARVEFRGIWRGHVIVIRNTTLSETLFIDGKEVAQGQGRLKLSETLAGAIDDGGEQIPVLAQIDPANLGMSIGAKLFVGGEMVPLERGSVGAFTSDRAPELPSAPRNPQREPNDPRWAAMGSLLGAVCARSPEAAEICEQARSAVRALLLDIEDIAEAEISHRLLDGETGDASRQAAALREQREMAVRELFRAVQTLHLETLAEASAPADLLTRLRSEAEIASTSRGDRSRLQLASAKRSEML